MKTDYQGHDAAYRQLKADGKVGWDKTPAAYEAIERQLKSIIDSCKIPSQGRLLEMGCGAGNISLWLEKQGYEVTGVDISPTAIEWARSKALDVGATAKFYVGNVLDMSFLEDGQFNIVIDGHCLHCIIGDDRRAFLSEALRVLKPGGTLLIDTMCGPVIGTQLAGYDPKTRCTVLNGVATRYFGLPAEVEKEVIDAGFRLISTTKEFEVSHCNVIIEAAKPVGK